MVSDKKALRRIARQKELEAGEEYLRDSDEESFKKLYSLTEYKLARTVFCYHGIGTEPNTRRLISHALDDGKTVALPRVRGAGIMEARVIYGLRELCEGTFGIPEPSEYTEILPPEEIDLIIVPALAFDIRGNRLGRGGGYYDRYLKMTNGVAVGIGREKLLFSELPRLEHDIPVKILVTEEKVRGPF